MLVQPDLLPKLLAAWGLENATPAPELTPTYNAANILVLTSDRRRYVLKKKASCDRLEEEYTLLAALQAEGIPVAIPISTRDGHHYVRFEDGLYCLSPYLYGQVISDHFGPGATERVGALGAAIARLHSALQRLEPALRLSTMDLQRHIEVAGAAVCTAGAPCERILAELLEEFKPLAPALPMQPIHRDAHPDNMLFLNGNLSGWLDFEIAVRGVRIYDPCYCATAILSGAWGDPEHVRQWPSLLAGIIRGYDAANPLQPVERQALWHVMLAIEFIFAAFYQHLGDREGTTRNLEMLEWLYEQRDTINAAVGYSRG